MSEESKGIFGFGIIDPDKIKENIRKDLKKTVNETIAETGGEVVKKVISNAILTRIEKLRGGEKSG